MIYYDVTKMGAARHKSGLTRVSARVLGALDGAAHLVSWKGGRFVGESGGPIAFRAEDWLLTVELFSGAERPGFREFVAARPCRLGAIFADAIPLKFPHITWPQSVQRHADYMKILAGFDRVWAISDYVRDELTGFWRWQGAPVRARIDRVELGADFDTSPRTTTAPPLASRASLLCVGIVEPRKNQAFLVDVAEALWSDGIDFDLHIVGRMNPHFGEPIVRKIKATAKREPRLHLHLAASDAKLRELYGAARAVVFTTIAEGCGLPVIEALWRGVPAVCSDLPVLRELTDAGGCVTARVNDLADWTAKLRAVLGDAALQQRLRAEAVTRPLPTWKQAGEALLAELR
ncbi:MAG: glycosyltransferase [Opitutae bacterium]|nr:glycosyltransferase [Opitutae bacterium]